jgi:hypothetical protein
LCSRPCGNFFFDIKDILKKGVPEENYVLPFLIMVLFIIYNNNGAIYNNNNNNNNNNVYNNGAIYFKIGH